MYFSRIMLNPFPDNKQLIQTLFRNVYSEHQIIWKFFDRDSKVKRDFLYRQIIEKGRIKYYVLSKREPISDNNLWDIQTKKYFPNLKKGQRISFMLRANPVVTISNSIGQKTRCDVVMHTKKQLDYKNLVLERRLSTQELVQKSGVEWLEKQAKKNGFKIDVHIQADGYCRHISRRPNGQKIEFRSIDFKGILEITNTEIFNSALLNGIGKSKSFGCGLFLIKKVL